MKDLVDACLLLVEFCLCRTRYVSPMVFSSCLAGTPTCMLSALVAGLPHRALYDAELAICVGLEWDMAAILRSAELLG